MTIKCSFFNACYYARCTSLAIHSLYSFSVLFSKYTRNDCAQWCVCVCLLTQQHNHLNKHIRQTANGHKWYKKLFVYHFSNKSPSMTIHPHEETTPHTNTQVNKNWLFWLECLNLLRYWFQCFSIYTLIRVSVNDRWWYSFPPLYWILARKSFPSHSILACCVF